MQLVFIYLKRLQSVIHSPNDQRRSGQKSGRLAFTKRGTITYRRFNSSSMSTMIFLLGLLFALATNCICAEVNESAIGGKRYPIHESCHDDIPNKVDVKLSAGLVYSSMAAFFDRNSVGKKGFAKFFLEKSKQQQEHAQKLINYLNRRGGAFKSFNITMPEKYTWKNGLEAFTNALSLETDIHDQMYQLHELGGKTCSDAHLRYFLNKELFTEQIESIDTLRSYVFSLQAMEGGIGEYLFDRQLLEKKTEL